MTIRTTVAPAAAVPPRLAFTRRVVSCRGAGVEGQLGTADRVGASTPQPVVASF